MGRDDDGPRPSFTSFWKRGKQKLKGSVSEQRKSDETDISPDAAGMPKTDQEKAQARRAQVRRAQIQHRQRKANYMKQLEVDASQLRDLVALTEKETASLTKENYLIRQALERAGVDVRALTSPDPAATTSAEDALRNMQLNPSPPGFEESPRAVEESAELFGDIDIDDLTVTLSMDSELGTPCFQISSSSSSTGVTSGASPENVIRGTRLSGEQERRAVNFVLGLEHCCWDHYWLGDFHIHSDKYPDSDKERGHALMASAYCMASAPENVYADRAVFQSRSKNKATNPTLTWGAPGFNLESLHGLAASLNPGDLEITPVQAWFELANRYPIELLMGGDVLDSLQREFKGVSKCVFYGAVIERMAFESIIARVLGPSEGSLLA